MTDQKQTKKQTMAVIMGAEKIVSQEGEYYLTLEEKFAVYNALKPLINRKYKEIIKEQMQSHLPENMKQMDVVDAIAEQAAQQTLQPKPNQIKPTK